MGRQDQQIEGGEAYQAGGNLTVTHGMNADQMAAVMLAMGKQLHVYLSEAEAKVEERLEDFRKTVIEEFAKPENDAKPEAFSDPDFQFVLNDAQKVFVRDGEEELRDDLVKLLVHRSKLDSKERTAKILNFAIEVAGSLSKNEYAALAMNFLFTSVKLNTKDRNVLIGQFRSYIAPFYQDLSDNQTVYEYIEAQRCGAINYLVTRGLTDSLVKEYSSVLSYGFTQKQLIEVYPDGDDKIFSGLTEPAAGYRGNLRFIDSNPSDLAAKLRERGMPEIAIGGATGLHNVSNPNEEQLTQIFSEEIEGFAHIKHIWDTTSLSKMTLTAVGKAIAHSSLTSRTSFAAPLSIWVQ